MLIGEKVRLASEILRASQMGRGVQFFLAEVYRHCCVGFLILTNTC